MTPIRMQEPGSSDVVTVSLWELRTAGTYYELGEFLAATHPYYWPIVNGQSVDQQAAWRGECARVNNAGGLILIARHTSSADRIVGIAIGAPTGNDNEMEKLTVKAAYNAEALEPLLLAALRQQSAQIGMVLGRAEMSRRGVAI